MMCSMSVCPTKLPDFKAGKCHSFLDLKNLAQVPIYDKLQKHLLTKEVCTEYNGGRDIKDIHKYT